MLALTKPKRIVPIHDEFRMQVEHGRLAIEAGVEPENVFIIQNCTPIELWPDGSARRGEPVTAGYVFAAWSHLTGRQAGCAPGMLGTPRAVRVR